MISFLKTEKYVKEACRTEDARYLGYKKGHGMACRKNNDLIIYNL